MHGQIALTNKPPLSPVLYDLWLRHITGPFESSHFKPYKRLLTVGYIAFFFSYSSSYLLRFALKKILLVMIT